MRVVALGVLLLASSATLAIPITYEFSGYINRSEITQDNNYPPAPDLGVYVGMSFNGVVNYDPEALDCFGTAVIKYACDWSAQSPYWMVTFGNFVLTSSGAHVAVGDDSVRFQFGGNQFLPPVYDGWKPLAQSDTYLFLSGNSAASLDVPPVDLDWVTHGAWIENAFLQPFLDQSDGLRWDVGGTITHFERVPEPSTLAILSSTLSLLFLSRRRRAQLSLASSRQGSGLCLLGMRGWPHCWFRTSEIG